MKLKREYQIVCSGKDKPWHKTGKNVTHTHKKASEDKAVADADAANEATYTRDTLYAECQPWRVQFREIGPWVTVE